MNEGQRQIFNFGRFVLAFAQVEAYLRVTLTELGKVSDIVSKIVLSGARVEDVISYLTKLLKTHSLDAQMTAEYTDVFKHFGPIKDARNIVLHYGIDSHGLGGFVATNRSKMLNPLEATVIPVSADIFEEMMDDLNKMTAILVNNLLRLDGTSPAALAFDPDAKRPWRYTPPPQGGRSKQKD